jgi:hypothetical protein
VKILKKSDPKKQLKKISQPCCSPMLAADKSAVISTQG